MTATMNTYEAMFVLDAGQGDFEAACEPIRKVLERGGAEMIGLKLWEERRLAYEIQGRRRGTYVLVYFQMDPANITELENDCKLEERILRVLILRKQEVTEEELNAETPATSPRDVEERPRRRRSEDDRDRDDGDGSDDSSDSDDSDDEEEAESDDSDEDKD
ncbi:MAG: 30S ribosomal protein S6 [Phycisphaerae bacterium]